MTLENAAREYVWLYDFRHGIAPEEIARREGVTVERVRFGLDRAAAIDARRSDRDDLPDSTAGFKLIPLFPVGQFTPQSACPHDGPIPRGSRLVCMVCGASGMDDHPGLKRDRDLSEVTPVRPDRRRRQGPG
jgi:hypothetical protein